MSLSVPTFELHARYQRDGLTRYSYEDIVAAAAQYEASVVAHEEATQRAWAFIEANAPHGTHWLAWWSLLRPHVAAVYDVMCEDATYCSGSMGKTRESWPIRKWQAAAKANRRLVQRIDRALTTAKGQQQT